MRVGAGLTRTEFIISVWVRLHRSDKKRKRLLEAEFFFHREDNAPNPPYGNGQF
jgi:hypothetical protein